MGFGGWELLLVALIVILIFGTKKLRNIGHDLGSGLKSFKDAMKSQDANESKKDESTVTIEQKREHTEKEDDTKSSNKD